MSPYDTRTERNLMPEIEFSAGTHLRDAIWQLIGKTNENNEEYSATFNGIPLRAYPDGKPPAVQALAIETLWNAKSAQRSEEYRNSPEGKRAAQEGEDHKNSCQATIDELMLRFETLDYENLDELVQFFDEMADPSDHVDVTVPRALIIETFARHGFRPSMNCGGEFNGEDRENYAKYLIGQALSGLNSFGAIHHIYHKFVAEWRGKFATV